MSQEIIENQKSLTSIRKRFWRHLSEMNDITDLSNRFGALNSNAERVDFALNLLKTSDITVEFQSGHKSDAIAVALREQGNEMFKSKRLKDAYEFYTRSICNAEEGSVNLGLAYANRSAVLFEANLHKQCLMDINQALNNNYPDHLKQKLFVRQRNSKNVDSEAANKPFETIPVVANKNSKIQCADSCLEIQEDSEFGRFVVAARDIQAGEVLCVEKPFACIIVNKFLSHCHECLTLCYNLVPCKDCVYTLYCSENCRVQAYNKYHKYECRILPTIKSLELDKLKLLSLRIALLAKDYYSELDTIDTDMDDFYHSDRYKEIHNLITNTSKRTVGDLFERAFAAAVIFNLVKDNTNFFSATNEKVENIFKEILLLHMQTGPSNFHEIVELSFHPSGTYEPEEIGGGAYAFLSLLNHSCCHNVTRFSYGTSQVLRAIQDIKKGEQCFDNYGYHFAVMDKTERQMHLKDQYYFECICQACENNWPLYKAFPSTDSIDDSLIESLWTGDVNTAKIVLEETLAKLRDLQHLQPHKSFCQLQEVVKQCFAIFGNKRRIF